MTVLQNLCAPLRRKSLFFNAELRRACKMAVIIKPLRASAMKAVVFYRGVTQR